MQRMRHLLLATKNAHKTAEVAALLGPGWQIEDLTAHPGIAAPEETGTTFAANATIKALAAARIFPGLVLADDSGLEVDALDGAPGVFSARYAGPGASDAENRARLLRELPGFPARARFRCVLVLAAGDKVLAECSGAVEGAIISQERGTGGFGYDALFVPEGFTGTFAELPATVKNTLSHRARAFAVLRDFLEKER
jgi:XTP/dITP diphosphohydrolase